MKKVLVISTTMRKGGNSEILAEEFAKGGRASGNSVEVLSLIDKDIRFCKGCLSCVNTNKCIIKDDMSEIVLKVRECDVLVFATPVYYYEMSGQMKTLIDRCNPNYSSDYKFRKVYLIATAAEDDMSAVTGTISGVQGFVDCYGKCELAGVVYGIGLEGVGDAKSARKILEEAFEMGKKA